jgi:peptide/nickel transport system substrate-binding protein
MSEEAGIRALVSDVRSGRLSRRDFMQTMLALGVSAPLAAHVLGTAGVAHAQTAPAPAKRGGGGTPRRRSTPRSRSA